MQHALSLLARCGPRSAAFRVVASHDRVLPSLTCQTYVRPTQCEPGVSRPTRPIAIPAASQPLAQPPAFAAAPIDTWTVYKVADLRKIATHSEIDYTNYTSAADFCDLFVAAGLASSGNKRGGPPCLLIPAFIHRKSTTVLNKRKSPDAGKTHTSRVFV